MHIMLFGGAFDPPHLGHLQVAEAVVSHGQADEVRFVPCAQHPFGKTMTPAADRVAMLKLAGPLKLELFEIEQPTTNYSVDTLHHFASTQPEHRFSWLIGSDQLANFTRWHRWQELLEQYRIYVYPRQDFPFDPMLPGMVPLTNLAPIAISSTAIRTLVAQGEPIDHLVPPAVADYITRHHLYAN